MTVNLSFFTSKTYAHVQCIVFIIDFHKSRKLFMTIFVQNCVCESLLDWLIHALKFGISKQTLKSNIRNKNIHCINWYFLKCNWNPIELVFNFLWIIMDLIMFLKLSISKRCLKSIRFSYVTLFDLKPWVKNTDGKALRKRKTCNELRAKIQILIEKNFTDKLELLDWYLKWVLVEVSSGRKNIHRIYLVNVQQLDQQGKEHHSHHQRRCSFQIYNENFKCSN